MDNDVINRFKYSISHQWRNQEGANGAMARQKYFRFQRPYRHKGPYRLRAPIQTRGHHGQRAHTDKGPLQTKDSYRHCVIPTDKGPLQTIWGPYGQLRAPIDN